jgi:hypothetical protein
MRRAAVVAIGTAVGAGLIGWSVAASYLFVAMAGLSGLLERPWLAWWLYAANTPDGWTVALLAVSASLPLAFAAAWRLTGGFYRSVRPLYGASEWASDADQQSASIKQSRSPF